MFVQKETAPAALVSEIEVRAAERARIQEIETMYRAKTVATTNSSKWGVNQTVQR